MESLELFFRFGAITLFAGQIILICRQARSSAIARFYGLMALGLIGFLATHASVDLGLPGYLHFPLSFFSKAAALAIWWFVFSVFDDSFKLGRIEISFSIFWIALIPFDFPAIWQLNPDLAALASTTRIVASYGLVVFILAKLWADFSEDLVEARRWARLWVPAVILGLLVIDLASDYLTGYGAPPLAYSVIQKAAIFAFAAAVMLAVTRVDLDQISPAPKPCPARSSTDPVLYERLQAELETGVFLDAELNLSQLAKKLAVSEARLRALINSDLGYRNFRTFLNHHRVEAAKVALSDPARASEPIIAIAMESGFNALPSFNRVFKEMTGQTPSEFRSKNSQ